MVRVADIIARCPLRHDNVGYLLATVLIQAGHRRNRDTAGYPGAGVGDKVLGAVDLPGAVLKLGMGLGTSRVRAGPRFGEAERPELLAPGQGYQVSLFLQRCAKEVKWCSAERRMSLHRDRD